MPQYPLEDKLRLKRQRTEQAIALAMQNRWEEALSVNKDIIELFPAEVDAYNRLGKALTEVGRYQEAKDAYSKALELDPTNAIAQKNWERLSRLDQPSGNSQKATKIDLHLFIEEMGKAGVTTLINLADDQVLAKMTAGDQVYLKIVGSRLLTENAGGEYLGQIEPKLASRLIGLMKGGNRYAAAITSMNNGQFRIIIKEMYQDPSQIGKVSFPTKGGEGFRPYIKDSILRYEMEDEDSLAEDDLSGWAVESEVGRGKSEDYEDKKFFVASEEDELEA